jgi:hypothetical protein
MKTGGLGIQPTGRAAVAGDYILSLADPEPLLRQLIGYEKEASYDFDPDILQ